MFSRTAASSLTLGQYLANHGLRRDHIGEDRLATLQCRLRMLVEKDGVAVTPETIAAKIKALVPDAAAAGDVVWSVSLSDAARNACDAAHLPRPIGLQTLARDFLKETGALNATNTQVSETAYALHEALASDAWKTFVSPFKARSIEKVPGNDERQSFFGEEMILSELDLTLEELKLTPEQKKSVLGAFENGTTGRLLAASFIDRPGRDTGDFSFASGEEAWTGFVHAQTHLAQIPQGTFVAALDVDLICATNGLANTRDGGALRTKAKFADLHTLTPEQFTHLHEAGIETRTLTPKRSWLEYPPADHVRPLLERAIAALKEALAKPDADPIDAAADFERTFVAVNPFAGDSVRTARLLLNRIVADYDLPPAIFRDENSALFATPAQCRLEVRRAVARGKAAALDCTIGDDDYLTAVGFKLPPSPDKPVLIGAMPYDLGKDGLLYDLSGRAHVVSGGALVPLAQMESYILARRVMMMGVEAGTAKLFEITAETRDAYAKLAATPAQEVKLAIVDGDRARAADVTYSLDPHPAVAKLLTSLATTASLDKAQLFAIPRSHATVVEVADVAVETKSAGDGTPQSATMSKYTQVDLEWWYLEHALRKSQPQLADQVLHERKKLFLLAKQNLQANANPSRVTRENPYGFVYRYEWMMWQRSPLRFASLTHAVDRMGDDHVTVWRGDYAIARVLGMAPNNDVRQKDARAIAKARGRRHVIANLTRDLTTLEVSAVGSAYISTTSDLSLLQGQFAVGNKRREVALSNVPKTWRHRMLDAISRRGGVALQDKLGVPGKLVTFDAQTSDHVGVTAERKVFELQVPKSSLLPGLTALAPYTLNEEQELHGLERVQPWKVRAVYESEILGQTLPLSVSSS